MVETDRTREIKSDEERERVCVREREIEREKASIPWQQLWSCLKVSDYQKKIYFLRRLCFAVCGETKE